jgi:hypothetical protein
MTAVGGMITLHAASSYKQDALGIISDTNAVYAKMERCSLSQT